MAEEKKAAEKTIKVQYHMHLPTHFTVNGKEYSLYKGETYTLPDVDFVHGLIKMKRATEVK